jgi:hypothetical protein
LKEEITQHIRRGEHYIRVAVDLAELSHWDDAISRAYYAMFHTATAVLLSLNVSRSSHHALISAFGEYVAKPGMMDKKFHRYLLDGFSARSASDYEPVTDADELGALAIINQAREFLEAAKDFLTQSDH